MSQQYPQQPNQPQQPQQPGYGYPGPGYGAPAPQPPKKRGFAKIAGLGCAGIIALFVIVGVATSGGGDDSTDNSGKDKAVVADDKPKADEAKDEQAKEQPAEETKTQAEEFQACVEKSGTSTEKKAVKHVTKVTGADKRNNILDAPEIFTDFSGGLMGPHQGEGKLIASAFTSCYESDNGLVTVYDKDGEILANANY
ncbi:hypothetical protein [Streptomyces sp. TRM68367]|uniref:hypothetical protein n=1 Tax=Streptomyces sp. TRM68367 TaxID=2758415 RepID=UPI00165B7727|nr:hypothetical protein [Streptomyces sp. TRM68367]MBC9727587.1 hypothetical protein [Streptomyces sp. TRM68367]